MRVQFEGNRPSTFVSSIEQIFVVDNPCEVRSCSRTQDSAFMVWGVGSAEWRVVGAVVKF